MHTREEKIAAFGRLLDIMDQLREQCPWNAAQTMDTIRPMTEEEVYELSDTILEGDRQGTAKEIGDLLYHMVFYARIGEEEGAFDIADSINKVCDKMVFRHPHVFGPDAGKHTSAKEIADTWELVKAKEKDGNKTVMGGIPKAMPAMLKALSMQEKARGCGFDWEKREDVWAKVCGPGSGPQPHLRKIPPPLHLRGAGDPPQRPQTFRHDPGPDGRPLGPGQGEGAVGAARTPPRAHVFSIFAGKCLSLQVKTIFMAENTLLEKVLSLQDKYKKLEEQLADPAVIADMKKFVQLNKDYKELQPIIAAGLEYKRLVDELSQAKDILMNEKDDDLKEMAKDEIAQIEPQLPEMEQNIKLLLIPADPDDSKNAMVEIRGGTGGDEAAIFAGDLFRMYQHFAERRGWKLEVSDQAPGTSGGFKQIVFKLSSSTDGVYGVMKYESGVHRVQRVPQTETQGRIQTSAASVAVFPEAGEFDIELNPADIRKDLFCASGPGGQGVNTTYSAVRLTHIPSGIVVQCQEERSQLKNLDRAMEELRTRLYNMEHQKYLDGIAAKRKTMVSTGDRSAKIRTYNYPQGRVTDHRIGWSMYNLPVFMDGDIQECIDQLQIAENAERLKEAGEEA